MFPKWWVMTPKGVGSWFGGEGVAGHHKNGPEFKRSVYSVSVRIFVCLFVLQWGGRGGEEENPHFCAFKKIPLRKIQGSH